jgi:S1-C subfamily serine protease
MRISLILFLCSIWPVLLHGASLPDVVDRVRAGVVGVGKIYPPKQPIPRNKHRLTFSGTGFVVGNGQLIITNAHVIPREFDTDNNETLAVFSGRGGDSQVSIARVIKVDDEHDLAVLGIDSKSLPALSLGDSDGVREGQEIALTGFPIGTVLGLYPATHRGIVAAITPMARPAERANNLSAAQIRRMRNMFDAFQLDAIAYPGNSGSPVYETETGRVIGVVNSVVVKESRESLLSSPSGISYAIPAKYVKKLLDSL